MMTDDELCKALDRVEALALATINEATVRDRQKVMNTIMIAKARIRALRQTLKTAHKSPLERGA